MTLLLAGLSASIWLYLVLFRGGFWRGREHDSVLARSPTPRTWPSIVAVIPARNEAETIARAVGSLLHQDYPGSFRVVVVDDGSGDGTAAIARSAADVACRPDRLAVLHGADLPSGWTGKLWALNQGLDSLGHDETPPDYVLFMDADIAAGPGVLRRLVSGAEEHGFLLTSLMARLNCASTAERWLIPAFIFFFQKLYPFRHVNDPRHPKAGAAGGCMLIRHDALLRAGGIAAIRGSLIDDCATGALMKRRGPIWLGLTDDVVSLRDYGRFDDIRAMVVRSAYAELGYSPLVLGGMMVGMVATYLVPVAALLSSDGAAAALGAATWLLMAFVYWPTLRFYGVSGLQALALPAIAAVFMGFTIESALVQALGRGGAWKGRYQAPFASEPGTA